MELIIFPPTKNTTDLIQTYIDKVDAVVAHRILGGFYWQPPLSCVPDVSVEKQRGETIPEYKFSTKLTDQTNYTEHMNNYVCALAMPDKPFVATITGWLGTTVQHVLTFDKVTFPMFMDQYQSHKNTHLVMGREMKARLRACRLKRELDQVFYSYNIDEIEIRDALDALK